MHIQKAKLEVRSTAPATALSVLLSLYGWVGNRLKQSQVQSFALLTGTMIASQVTSNKDLHTYVVYSHRYIA